MSTHQSLFGFIAAVGLGLATLAPWASGKPGDEKQPDAAPGGDRAADERGTRPDSYLYYGPNGLWKYWNDDANNPDAAGQRLGRDTWIHWTWGNQKFLRKVAVMAGHLPAPVSIDFFRVLDSRNRATRFRDLGLINEPNCVSNPKPDRYGLYLDESKGDPLGYYPTDPRYKQRHAPAYADGNKEVELLQYGRPTGIVGLRLFDNPQFDEKKWNLKAYFENPGRVEPPYLVGFSCAFCHIAFDPLNPPLDPENPRWENLAANLGNQYFREGELFLGKGRVIFGNQHPHPAAGGDPYADRGLLEEDFLYHYAVTQQPGTSETSRISYDFINNPNTINPLFGLKYRPLHSETPPYRKDPVQTWNILKDGSDSVGINWALMRVPINIFCEGDYWLSRLFDPVTGRRQRPFRIGEVLSGLPDAERRRVEEELGPVFKDVTPERVAELRKDYTSPYGKERFGHDWEEAWRRVDGLKKYLTSYGPSHLEDATGAGNEADARAAREAIPKDQIRLANGKKLFLSKCATCHSSVSPDSVPEAQRAQFEADFPKQNYLADDARYPATVLGTNLARAMATNAIDGDIWAELSSREYKALPPLGRVTLQVPVFPAEAPLPTSIKDPIRIDYEPPGGGRGYYRTPSLIGMWATAPYLHNNALGDYAVVTDRGERVLFPNDGRRIGRKGPDGNWVDYRLDVSVEGRLKMFEDAADKLLNPARRRNWVKRAAADCTLIPDLENTVPRLILAAARDFVRVELESWLRDQQVPPEVVAAVLRAAGDAFDRATREVKDDVRVTLRFGWVAAHLKLRGHADRLFGRVYDDLKLSIADSPLPAKYPRLGVALEKLKPVIREALLGYVDRVERELREASILKIPAGTPLNLYLNLDARAVPYAALAHVRYRNDPRGLARALLELSDCPDLVEDRGHVYGSELSDADKADLIQFLKTL